MSRPGSSGAPPASEPDTVPQVYSSSPARHMANQAAMIGTHLP